MLMDLKFWVSVTITYQESCLDAFENSTSDAREKMKGILKSSMHLSSNALAMVSRVSSVLIDSLPIEGHDDDDNDQQVPKSFN